MNNNERNVVDKFLDGYEYANNEKIVYKRVYQRPSKIKSIFGFIFCLIFFIILIRFFVFKLLYFVILLFDIAVLSYYAINLFTKNGIGLPKTIEVKEEVEEATKEHEDTYRVQ